MRNGVQLITYVDRFGGGGISDVQELLDGPLADVFTGIHLLPFYVPFDGEDAGFDPIDHAVVDPRLGTWDDLARLAVHHDVTADLIVNHISDQSRQFEDFVEHGAESSNAEMFLEYDTVFPDGATQEDVLAIYRPRPGPPFTIIAMDDGSTRLMWTTFTPHQIDLDIRSDQARSYLRDILDRLSASGVRQVRLDAVGYSVKTAGTSSFMTADTFKLIAELMHDVHDRGMVTLLEIHSHFTDQIEMGAVADHVYDFALPPLILHGLYTGCAEPLRNWFKISPRNAITVLDTHDGIGVIDVGPSGGLAGLLSGDQIDELVDGIGKSTNGESVTATGTAASNLDLYQVNSTYFSALGCDEDKYLVARLIQFLAPGIPQVYYAGLLAASNDTALLERTGVGRDINRPHYTFAEVVDELNRPVVRRLIALAKFRNTHAAFNGTFSCLPDQDHVLHMSWTNDNATLDAWIDVADATFRLDHSHGHGDQETITNWDQFSTSASRCT